MQIVLYTLEHVKYILKKTQPRSQFLLMTAACLEYVDFESWIFDGKH